MRQLVFVTCFATFFLLSCTTDNRNSPTNANGNLSPSTQNANANVGVAASPSPTCPAKDPSFNLAYEATKDTQWTSNPNPPPGTTPQTGTVAKGTKVFFDHVAPVTPSWQLAMFEDGCKKYVRPGDFKKL